jgi:hypothetical protein
MKRYFSLILAIAATVSAQIVPSTGNVRGPTSATDNAVARYDGTTGKLVQNSGVTIDDSGNLTVSGTGTSSVAGNLTVGNDKSILVNKLSGAPSLSAASGGLQVTQYDLVTSLQFGGYNTAPYALWLQGTNNAGSSFPISINPLGGNLLVGTTTDGGQKLQVNGTGFIGDTLTVSKAQAGSYTSLNVANANATGYAQLNLTSAANTAEINYASGLFFKLVTPSTDPFVISTNGTDALTINSSQALRLNAYGAGTLTTDSSGNVTATSDERAKNITGTFTKGLAEVVKLTPKTYTWKPETGLNTTDEVASLTAQDLIAAGIPEAVSTYRTVADLDEDGKQKLDANAKPLTKRIEATYTVSDRAVIAALVNAVKELKAEVDALKAARN